MEHDRVDNVYCLNLACRFYFYYAISLHNLRGINVYKEKFATLIQ